MKYYCKNEIYVSGMRRSGIHAILNWVLPQFEGSKVTLTDIHNDFSSVYDLKIDLKSKILNWYFEKKNYKKPTTEALKKMPSVNNIFFDIQERRFKKFHSIFIGSLKREKFIENLGVNDIGKEKYFIFVLRNPYNLFASRMKLFKNSSEHYNIFAPNVIESWKEMARELLGQTDYLSSFPGKSYIIIFDKWFTDYEYRKSISSKLGLNFTDEGLNTVTKDGGGSSFDKRKYNQEAQKMNVLQRWESYTEDKDYINFFNNQPEMVELTEKIFDMKKPF